MSTWPCLTTHFEDCVYLPPINKGETWKEWGGGENKVKPRIINIMYENCWPEGKDLRLLCITKTSGSLAAAGQGKEKGNKGKEQ